MSRKHVVWMLAVLMLIAGPLAAQLTVTATELEVVNGTTSDVYANLVLGQPPASPPPNCSNLGNQIKSLTDTRLVFVSSNGGTKISFTVPTAADDKGYYKLAAGESITYMPQPCASGDNDCTPALTFNFFFTASDDGFDANNGCSNATFPNATNLAEGSINFSINGSVGSGCANPDTTDISAVNGVNAKIAIDTSGSGWPYPSAQNGALGTNADRNGVFGWAATNCTNSAGFPNPSTVCAAPVDAPVAPASGQCTTPNGTNYAPISLGTPGATQYCAQLSDSGTCNNQRTASTTGGTVTVTYSGSIAPKN
ncbi:MAG: hypothetical protein AAGD38_19195 [Acidobacteriota bacterium]